MRYAQRIGYAAVAAMVLSACQTGPTTQEMKTALELEPMEKPPSPELGEVIVSQNGEGEKYRTKVVSVTDDLITLENSEGCRYSYAREYIWQFAPTVRWENCSGSTGQRNIESRSGDKVWPLELGKSWEFEASGYTSGNRWNSDRRCEVEGTARIETVTGKHDTYKVVCRGKWATRTYYVSPDVGRTVRFQRERLRGSITNRESEFIRVERPKSS